MNSITNQTYSSKSTAARGAKRAGIEKFEVTRNAEGKYVIVLPETKPKQPRAKAIKIPLLRKSEMSGVCSYIWDVCDEMLQDAVDNEAGKLSRNDVIARCVADGCAFYTARTQYQHWFALNRSIIAEALKGGSDDEDGEGVETKRPISKKAPVKH